MEVHKRKNKMMKVQQIDNVNKTLALFEWSGQSFQIKKNLLKLTTQSPCLRGRFAKREDLQIDRSDPWACKVYSAPVQRQASSKEKMIGISIKQTLCSHSPPSQKRKFNILFQLMGTTRRRQFLLKRSQDICASVPTTIKAAPNKNHKKKLKADSDQISDFQCKIFFVLDKKDFFYEFMVFKINQQLIEGCLVLILIAQKLLLKRFFPLFSRYDI